MGVPPQPKTPPSDLSARLCSPPAEILAIPEALTTCTGASRFILVPSPSWPEPFYPHARTVPSDMSARLWALPAETATTPERPLTCTGVCRSVLVPSPISPLAFNPQAWALPATWRLSAETLASGHAVVGVGVTVRVAVCAAAAGVGVADRVDDGIDVAVAEGVGVGVTGFGGRGPESPKSALRNEKSRISTAPFAFRSARGSNPASPCA